MRCPSCDHELTVNGQERLETLDEHVLCAREVSYKNKYVCTNPDCVLKPEDHCWNEFGEYYYTPVEYKPLDTTVFIDGLKCARGTSARQAEREYDYNDNAKRIPITKGRWKGWTKVIETHHTADLDGNILKSTKNVRWTTPEGIYYVSPFEMFRYSLSGIYKARKRGSRQYIKHLQDAIERSEWPHAEKWRKIVGSISKFLLNYDPKAAIYTPEVNHETRS